MNETLYQMIRKRKSFHQFRDMGRERVTQEDLAQIRAFWEGLKPLCPEIRVAMEIVPAEASTNQNGQEYCLAFYSEPRENYLQNIGYLGQRMELYLVSKNIGTCWYGIGKVKHPVPEGMEYVIMIALGKTDDPAKFRHDLAEAKRLPLEETWQGEPLAGVSDLARYAPSACNSQPWRVLRQGNRLEISRYYRGVRVGLLSPRYARFFNRIDLGIYLCFLTLCLDHEKLAYSLQLHPDLGTEAELTKVATLTLE